MLRKKMKLWYENFWGGFEPKEFYFTQILNKVTDIQITNENPDVIIYSVFGNFNPQSKSKSKKIFWTGENVLVGTNPLKKVLVEDYSHDISLSFDPDSKTNIQCPLWILYLNYENKDANNYYERIIEKREFQHKNKYCNFIYSNPATQSSIRNKFFNFLLSKRFVHSAGRYANNVGGPVKDKLDYIKNFVFTIAFENSYNDYYTTEKLLQPLLATSVPIYWGGQESIKHFNSKTFINAYERSFEEIENEMNELLKNQDIIIKMGTLPILEKFPKQFLPETIATKIMDNL